MGKKRIAFLDEEGKITTKKKKKEEHRKTRIAGLKGGERVVDMGVVVEETPKAGAKPVKVKKPGITEATKKSTEPRKKTPTSPTPSLPSKPSKPKVRGRAYQAARTKVDPTKLYPLEEAIELVKQVSISKFNGSIDAHFSTLKKGLTGEVNFPHFKGKIKKVVIADDKVLAKIKTAKIDFDVLLATKEFMPKLVPFAKVLGPKGLMPNPKAGTIVDDPKKALEKFQGGLTRFKTEKDQPLIHLKIGQVSQPENELEENLKALIIAIGPKNIKKLVICPTMGPGIKIQI